MLLITKSTIQKSIFDFTYSSGKICIISARNKYLKKDKFYFQFNISSKRLYTINLNNACIKCLKVKQMWTKITMCPSKYRKHSNP